MSDNPGKIVFYPHPFTNEGREDFDITKETRLALLLEEKTAKGSFSVNVNGKREPLESATMREGDFAIVRRVPEGASSASADQQRVGGKITGWSAAAAIIGVALMLTGNVPAGLQVFITGVAGMVTGALEYYGFGGTSSSSGTSTTRPDIRGASNSASAGGKVPLILGKNRLTPYYAAMPFTDVSIGDDGKYKYLNLLFVLGYGQLKISNIRLGELLLASNSADVRNGAIACDGQYGGVSMELRQDGALPENYSYVVQEQSLSTALSRFHTLNFSVTIDPAAKTITRNDGGNWGTDDVLIGDCIEMFGATNAGNNGIWIVTNATASVLTCFAVTSFVAETFTARMNVFPSNIAVSCAKTRRLGVEIEFANGLLTWNNGAKNDLGCDVRAFYRLKGAQGWTAFPSGWKGGGTILTTTTEKVWATAKTITTSRTGKTDKPWTASESFTVYTDSTKLINIQDGYEHSGDYNFRVDPNGDNGLIVYVDGTKYTLTDSKLLLVLSTGSHTIKITYGASNTYNTGGTVYCVTGGETTSESYPWLITRAKNETLRFYAETDLLPAGQYEVMVARYTGDRDNTSSLTYVDGVTWASFKAFTEREVWEEQTRAKVAFLCVRIRASNQLANTIAQLNLIAEGVYPAYSGSGSGASAWADAVTTNPAAAFLWLIRGPFNPRPVTLAARFDWAALEAWYMHCAGNFACNAVLSSASTAKTLLQAVCEVGRASFTLKDGLFSVAEDCVKSDIKQLITPRNSWGFSFSKSFDEIPHGLRVTFRNEDADYATDERIVLDDDYLYDIDNTGELVDAWGNAYAVGATNPATGNAYKQATKFEAVSYAYTTDPEEVFKHARFTLAVRRLRPETFTVNMDIEQLAVTRGDRVSVSHDVVSWGLDWGRVTELVRDANGNVTSLSFDEPVPFEVGKSYAFRYRTAAGINYATFSVAATAEYLTITPDAVIPAVNGLETDSLIQFGEAAIGFGDCVVVGVEQGEDYSAKLTLVEYNPAIFTAESGTIPAHDSKITKLATIATASGAAETSENQATVQVETETQATAEAAQATATAAAAAAAAASAAAAAAPALAPRNLGRFNAEHPASFNPGDWWLVYDTDDDPLQRGCWYSAAGTPTRISSVSGETGYTTDVALLAKMESTLLDVAWAEANAYGTAANYGMTTFFESLGVVTLLVNKIVSSHAFISQLATRTQFSSALCDDGVTPRMSIDWDNAILKALSSDQSLQIKLFDSILRSIEGNYVLDHEGQSLIFRLASTLAEVGRIKYDQTSGLIQAGLPGSTPSGGLSVPVKFAGSWLSGSWGTAAANGATVAANADTHDSTLLNDGSILHVYSNASKQLCERVETSAGVIGSEVIIDSNTYWYQVKCTTCGDGRVVLIAKQGQVTGAPHPASLYKAIRSTAGVWSGVSICLAGSLSCFFDINYNSFDGYIYIAYYRTDEVDHCIISRATSPENIYSGMGMSTSEGAFTNDPICLISKENTNGCIIYGLNSSGHLIEVAYDYDTWGTPTVINSTVQALYPNALISPNGITYLMFRNTTSSVMSLLTKTAAGVWDTAPVTVSGYFRPSMVLIGAGPIWCYSDNGGPQYKTIYSSSYSTIPQKTSFTKVGMGVVEKGVDASGEYEKWGDDSVTRPGMIPTAQPGTTLIDGMTWLV